MVNAFPPQYNITRVDRNVRRGGGLLIATVAGLEITPLESKSSEELELCLFRIDGRCKGTWRGALVYRPPGPRKDFTHILLELIAPHVLAAENFLLIGDFNHHAEILSDSDTNKLITSMDTLGLVQMVTGSTHSAGHTLDLLFSNSKDIVVEPSPRSTEIYHPSAYY